MVKLIGALLMVFGLVALLVGGFSYTKSKKVLDIGPIEATTHERKTIPISPIVGIAAMATGAVILVAGNRTRV